jgi:hypothetical protein
MEVVAPGERQLEDIIPRSRKIVMKKIYKYWRVFI